MNTDASTEKKQFRFTGWHMTACLVGFFGIIMAVNFFMAYTASSTWTGLVVKNSYVASQKFNRDLEASKRQTEAGWHSDISYRDGVFSILVKGNDGKPLGLEDPQLAYGRPAFEQKDNQAVLKSVEDGKYALSVKLMPGEWFVKVTGMVDGLTYRRDARLTVDANQNGTLQ